MKANEHISADQLAVLANRLNRQDEARQQQLAHAKRTIAIGRATNGKPFVITAEPELITTASDKVTVI